MLALGSTIEAASLGFIWANINPDCMHANGGRRDILRHLKHPHPFLLLRRIVRLQQPIYFQVKLERISVSFEAISKHHVYLQTALTTFNNNTS